MNKFCFFEILHASEENRRVSNFKIRAHRNSARKKLPAEKKLAGMRRRNERKQRQETREKEQV